MKYNWQADHQYSNPYASHGYGDHTTFSILLQCCSNSKDPEKSGKSMDFTHLSEQEKYLKEIKYISIFYTPLIEATLLETIRFFSSDSKLSLFFGKKVQGGRKVETVCTIIRSLNTCKQDTSKESTNSVRYCKITFSILSHTEATPLVLHNCNQFTIKTSPPNGVRLGAQL